MSTLRMHVRGAAVRLDVVDHAAFRSAVGVKVLVELTRAFAALDRLVALDAVLQQLVKSDDEHGGRCVGILLYATLVEAAQVAWDLWSVLGTEGLASEHRPALDAFRKRWRPRKELREGIGFHFDAGITQRGISELANRGEPVVLVDGRTKTPRFDYGTAALFAGLAMDDDGLRVAVTDGIRDVRSLSATLQEIVVSVVRARGVAVQIVEEAADVGEG